MQRGSSIGILNMQSKAAMTIRGLNRGYYRRSELLFFLGYLLVIFIFTAWITEVFPKLAYMGYEKMVGPWIVLFLLFNIVGLLLVKKVKYTDISLWFISLSYLFMFGHVFLYAFDLQTTLVWNPGTQYTNELKIYTIVYAIYSINLIFCGSFLSRSPVLDIGAQRRNESSHLVRKVGIICLIIGVPANLYYSISIVSVTQAAGSYAAYTEAASSGILDDLSYLLVPGVIYLLCSKTIGKSGNTLLTTASCLYYCVIMMLSGSRKIALFAIIAIMLCYMSQNKSGRSGKTLSILIYVLLAFLLLDLLYVIRDNRFDLLSIPERYLESLSSFDFVIKLAGETLAETGLTFYSVVNIVKTVPSVFPFEYGMTFVRTLVSTLPIGWLVGDFFAQASSTQVINTYVNVPAGSSLLGDFYWNYGAVGGAAFSFLFGVLLAKLYGRSKEKPHNNAFYFSVVYILLTGVRAGVFELYRPLLIASVLPYLLFRYFMLREARV